MFRCHLLAIFVAHRVPLAGANVVVSFFDEAEIVDLIERYRSLDPAGRAHRAHLLTHPFDIGRHHLFAGAADLRQVGSLFIAFAPDFFGFVQVVDAQELP